MTTQVVFNLLGSGGVALIVVALIKFFENRRTLKSAQPKTEAEAVDIGIGSQKKVIDTLAAENLRLDLKVQSAEALATLRETRHEERIRSFEQLLDQTKAEFSNQMEETAATFRAQRALHYRDIARLRQENRVFRSRVEALLISHSIAIPDWWPMAYEDNDAQETANPMAHQRDGDGS